MFGDDAHSESGGLEFVEVVADGLGVDVSGFPAAVGVLAGVFAHVAAVTESASGGLAVAVGGAAGGHSVTCSA